MLLKEIKNIFHKELDDSYRKEEVDSFFYMLIEHYLGLERFVLAMQPNLVISKEEEQPLFEALSQLRLHRPIQYIIGTSHFMDMDFSVDENVLIPRPETEGLVRWIVEEADLFQNAEHGSKRTILDIGTGSGCIAVSLAKLLPDYEVHALDISHEALQVARKNARANQVDVTFVETDILDCEDSRAEEGSKIGEGSGVKEASKIGEGSRVEEPLSIKYDTIVSNPPYVREQEKKDMHKNVTDYEPALALFVSDVDPLKFYDAIARFAKKNLKERGSLYLEINQYLAKETEQLLRKHNFSEIVLRKDLYGNDRMMKAVHSKID